MDIEEETSDSSLSEGEIDEIIELDMKTDASENHSEDSIASEPSTETTQEKLEQNLICVFKHHARPHPVYCGCLSQDGQLAATGSGEDIAYLWETATGNIRLKCDGHEDSVIFAEFNHKETYLATADMKGVIRLWDLHTKKCCWEYNIGDLFWIKWHHSADVLLASCENGEIYMWSLPSGKYKIFVGYGTVAECGVICPDGKSIVVGYRDGTIRMIDLKEGVAIAIPPNQGHTKLVTCIDCNVNNKLFISVSTDGKTILSTVHNDKIISVLLQDLNSGTSTKQNNYMENEQESQDESHQNNWAETVAFSRDPTLPLAASATVNGELFIWDVSKQILRHKIDICITGAITKVLWKGNTSILFMAGADGAIRCINAKTGDCFLRAYRGHKDTILDLRISKDEKRLLTVSDDSTARVFDISSVS